MLSSRCFDLTFVNPHTGIAANSRSFYVLLPNPGGVARLSVTAGSSELASRQVSSHRPTVTVISPNGSESWSANGTHTIRWSASDQDGDSLSFSVFFSYDGTNWVPLASGIQDTQVNIDLVELGGGSAAKVKVEVTDGINTGSDESDGTFSVAPKAPWAVILSPQQGTVIPTGHAILLQGNALSLEDGTLGDAAYRWSSNRDGSLGTGASLLAVLSPGAHTITLTTMNCVGLTTSTSVEVLVGAKAYLPVILKSPGGTL